jgi:hypothetical protein
VILKLIGVLSASMLRDKIEEVILEEEIVLWGTKIQTPTFDKTYSREVASLEYDTPKKLAKDEWEIGVMEEGEHPFMFELDLPPKSMPSSIDVISSLYLSNCSSEKGRLHTRSNVFINGPRRSSALLETGPSGKRTFQSSILSMSPAFEALSPLLSSFSITRRKEKQQDP